MILPINKVATMITNKISFQAGPGPKSSDFAANNLIKAKNPAALTMVAMKEVNTLGAPSYTSGAQKWNGAADTLKHIEINNNTKPTGARIPALLKPVTADLIVVDCKPKLPVAP